jgi:hypothetical protein
MVVVCANAEVETPHAITKQVTNRLIDRILLSCLASSGNVLWMALHTNRRKPGGKP